MGGGDRALLECRGVEKRYGGLVALRDVSFVVRPGQVFGIAGPNGAGKTTLFDVISGLSRPSAGQILFGGEEISRKGPDEIARLGILRTFQTPVSFPDLSVYENALVGAAFSADGGRTESGLRSRVMRALDLCGLSDVSTWRAEKLSVFARKRLMLASALAANPTILLLDEPVGGLNREERSALLDLIGRINASGVTVLVIEHVLSALVQLAEVVLILDHGAVIYQGSPAKMATDPEVVRVYLGEEVVPEADGGAIG